MHGPKGVAKQTTDERRELSELARLLFDDFKASAPTGYLPGKAALAQAVVKHRQCSEMHAHHLIQTMETKGFLRFSERLAVTEQNDRCWRIVPNPL